MNINKLAIAASLTVLLAACAKDEAAPAADAATADTAAAVDAAAADSADAVEAAAAGDSDLPQACADYLARAEACFSSASNMPAEMVTAMRDSFDQARAAWAGIDSATLSQACNTANDAFAQTVAALQCE